LICSLFLNAVSAAEVKEVLKARLAVRKNTLKVESGVETAVDETDGVQDADAVAVTNGVEDEELKTGLRARLNSRKSSLKVGDDSIAEKAQLVELKTESKKLFKSKSKAKVNAKDVESEELPKINLNPSKDVEKGSSEQVNQIITKVKTNLVETAAQSKVETKVENNEVEEIEEEEEESQEKIASSPLLKEESTRSVSLPNPSAAEISSKVGVKNIRSGTLHKKPSQSQIDSEMAEQSVAEGKVKGCVPNVPSRCPDGKMMKDLKVTSNTDGCGLSLPKHDALDALMSSTLKTKFAPCCNVHNICYSTVGSNKDDCDYLFYSCMLDQCDEWFCKSRAFWFYRTVSQLGCSAFESVQKVNGCGV